NNHFIGSASASRVRFVSAESRLRERSSSVTLEASANSGEENQLRMFKCSPNRLAAIAAPSTRDTRSSSSGARSVAGRDAAPGAGRSAASRLNLSAAVAIRRTTDREWRAPLLLHAAPSRPQAPRKTGSRLHMDTQE